MAVNLSPFGGVGAQFLDNSGNVLTGGKIYTYAAGTTTPQATYTSSLGNVALANPIILDASGRVPTGEIWLTDSLIYKFVLKDSNDVLIATYDNITGINSNFVAYTTEQEIQTATAGQTVFNLATTTYQPGTNSLSVFVDGVNQYGPGAQYAYLETDSDTVTFVNGLHVGAEVKFTTASLTTGNATNASVVAFTGFKGQTGNVQDLADDDGSDWIGFDQAGAGAVARSAQDKMRDFVSVMDFDADNTGVLSSTIAFQAAVDSLTNGGQVYVPEGTYYLDATVVVDDNITFVGTGAASVITSDAATTLSDAVDGSFCASSKDNIAFRNLKFTCRNTGNFRIKLILCSNVVIDGCYFDGNLTGGEIAQQPVYVGGSTDVNVQNSIFLDWRDAVYICKDDHSTGTSSGYVSISNCTFEQVNHGLAQRYPTGIYVYFGDDTLVTGCTFKNIKPSTVDPTYAGYGVYEGDGLANSVTVNGCNFFDNDGITTSSTRGVSFDTANQGLVTGCYFGGLDIGFVYTAVNTNITGNNFYDCGDAISPYTATVNPESIVISSNNIDTCSGYGIKIGGTGRANYPSCLISNNYIKLCARAGVLVQEADYSQIIGNTIIDCNTSDGSSTDFDIGISFYGPVYSYVDGNSVINTATGKMKYGISGYATSYNIIVTDNNFIKGMITAPTYNTRTTAPTTGTWERGTKFYFWNATAGGVEGTVCVTGGTPGTWKNFGSIAP